MNAPEKLPTLELRPPRDAAIKTVVEGAMRAMNDAGRRADASGVWALRDMEQAALLAGIRVIEEHLPKMDVLTLHESMQRFKAMQIADSVGAGGNVRAGLHEASAPAPVRPAPTAAMELTCH